MFAKKSLGQHFLTNKNVVAKMARAGAVSPKDVVLEIGPGTGILTRALLDAGATVVAIEADHRAITILEKEFEDEIKTKRLRLHHDDMRTIDLDAFYKTSHLKHGAFKVIANIPYYISGMLFEKMLGAQTKPATLVFLVQKEVAERIARSKKGSLLSLSVKAFGVPRYVGTVARGNFSPAPKVDSAILAVSDIPSTSAEHFKKVSETAFFSVLKAGFGARRKQLLGNLQRSDLCQRSDLGEACSRSNLEAVFSTLGIPKDARGEDIAIETWLSLTSALQIHTK